MAAHEEEPTVIARAEHGLGRLTLNRPRAINALDIGMIAQLTAALERWRDEIDVEIVLLDGAGDRGFCAGGDVRALREAALGGDADALQPFFRAEYTLNALVSEYPVPIVSVADGVTMGGGIGLASHAAIRVATERSRLAMPETRIGFTPDVGGTFLLSRAPGRLGEFLALTGTVMDASDAVYAGLADHVVPSDRLADLRDALRTRADPNGPAELVLLFDETPPTSRLEAARAWIDDAFAADTVPEIIERLRASDDPAAADAADTLDELAPTALAVTLEAVRRARALPDLRAVLAQEYGLVMWFAHTQPDMLEGIRAQVVDKDRSPRWQPAAHADVDIETVRSAFAFSPTLPLWP